jgi:hypothetical protein
MSNQIQAEDPSAQILTAWIAKEELRTLLATPVLGGDPHLTRHRLHRFLTWCIDSQIPELLTLAGTVDHWWPEINAFVDHRHLRRPHRGLQPTGQTGQTCQLRIPQSRQLDPPDTIPLHPQTAGRNPDLKLIARSKSKSRFEAGRERTSRAWRSAADGADAGLPRVFRIVDFASIYAASCVFRYSVRTSCGVR